MKHAVAFLLPSPLLRHALRVLSAVMFVAAASGAHADDYADVNNLLRQGKASEALTKADAYIVGKPRDPQMRFLRGVILTQQGKTDEATATFVQLTQDFPELPEPYNNLAALYAQQSRFGLARDALENAIRLNPNYATAHENLGDIYARLAAQSYAKAQQLASTNASAAPKLALIRQIFVPAPAPVRPVRPAASAASAASAPLTPASAPASK